MLNGDIDTVELEGQIVSTVSLEGDLLPIGPKGDKGDDGFSPVVTTSKSGKTTTIKFETATGNVYAYVQDGEDGQGSGDMLTDVYDQNKNGIVDNAEACNGHTLAKDVPADAVFTDTTYESKEAASGGSDVSLCTTGEKYAWNNKSDFSGSYNDLTNKPTIPTKTSDLTNDSGFINNTVNNLTNYTPTSSLSTVALTGSYSDLSNKPSIPSKTSDLTNDSGFIDKTVNDLTNYYKKSDTYTKTEANTLLEAKANSSDLATVATSGSYNDLSNKPTIPDELSDLSDDSTHRLVSDTEKTTWNNKVDSTGEATTTGENTSFSLTNVLEAPLLMDLKGNTSQYTLSGKNKLNKTLVDDSWRNANTTTQLSSGLKVSCREQGVYRWSAIPIPNSSSLLGKTLTISANVLRSGSNQAAFAAQFCSSSGLVQEIAMKDTTSSSLSLTFTVPNSFPTGATGIAILVYSTVGTTANVGDYVEYKNLQLEEGSTATAYEPYCGGVPSPNPSYPQNVNVVSGDNEIEISNATNVFNEYDYASKNNTYYSYSQANGLIILKNDDRGFGNIAGNYSVDGNTTYYFKGNTNINFAIAEYGINGTWNKNDNITSGSGSFTTSSTTRYVRFKVSSSGLTYPYNVGIVSISTSNNYKRDTYPINLPVENLYEKGTIHWFKNSSSTYDDRGDSNTSRIKSMPFQIKGGNTYIISGIPSGLKLNAGGPKCYDISKTYLGDNYVQYSGNTFTLPSNVAYIAIMCNGTNLDDTTNTLMNNADIQIEQGTKSNTYTPYGTTPIELCKIGTYQDYFYKEDDKWYLHKEVGKVVLDGSETGWGQSTISSNLYFKLVNSSYNHFRDSNCYSNNYKLMSSSELSSGIDYGLRIGGAEFIQVRNKDISSIADFQTWLSTHNTIVYYVLATPTNTEITYQPLINQLNSLEDAESYEGTTNINQVNNDLPFIINATVFNDNYNGRYEALDKRVSDNSNSIQVLNSEVDCLINYSTNEQVIGKWIDGKPLYRKVIDCGYLPNATSKNVAIGYNMNQINIVRLYGTARENTGYTISIPHVNNGNVSQQVQCEVSTNGIFLRTGVNYSVLYCYIIIEYTKTTD